MTSLEHRYRMGSLGWAPNRGEYLFDENESSFFNTPNLTIFAADAASRLDDANETRILAKTPITPDSLNASPEMLSDASSGKRTVSSATTQFTAGRDDDKATRILEDGNDDVDDWVGKYIHTDAEGTPWRPDAHSAASWSENGKASIMEPTASISLDSPSPELKWEAPLVQDATAADGSTEGQLMRGFTPTESQESSPPDSNMSSVDAMHEPGQAWPAAHFAHFLRPNAGLAMAMGQMQQHAFGGSGNNQHLAHCVPVTPHESMRSVMQHLHVFGLRDKSRVETQLSLTFWLPTRPPGIRRLHLPRHTISKPKLLAKPEPPPAPDMLELHAVLVCTSAMSHTDLRKRALQRSCEAARAGSKASFLPADASEEDKKPQNGGEVHICENCMLRERKRSTRKKVKNRQDEETWQKDEGRRVIVFNTSEVKEWSDAQTWKDEKKKTSRHDFPPGVVVDAPMRIACYCRHHHEKKGFKVIFTMTDHRHHVVAQIETSSIMITDDHKTPNPVGGSHHPYPPSDQVIVLQPLGTPAPRQVTGNPPIGTNHGMCAPPSRPKFVLDQPRDRQPPFPMFPSLGGVARESDFLSSPPEQPPAPASRNLSRSVSPNGFAGPAAKKRKASGSPKIPAVLAMTQIETSPLAMPQGPPNHGGGSMASAGPSPTSPGLEGFAADQGMAVFPGVPLAMRNLFPDPASRSSSPDRRGSSLVMSQASQAPDSLVGLVNMPAVMSPMTTARNAMIHKIIPAEGSKAGGVDVTVLGSGFYQGLEVMFGDNKATTTTYWGDSCLVCLLPPSAFAGMVPVTVKHPPPFPCPFPVQRPQTSTFRYIDDDEEQLMRHALAVIASKMNGNMLDVTALARTIIHTGGWNNKAMSTGQQQTGGPPMNAFAFGMSLETKLIKVLELIDLDDSFHKPRLNLRKAATRQTMLHLASSLGLDRFAAGLLARGAMPDLRDKAGYTPLHLAVLNNHKAIVRRLMASGADPTLRTLSGLRPADLARSKDVLMAVERLSRHRRSRSSGSMLSRASSASSLLPSSDHDSVDGDLASGENSPEYTSRRFLCDEEAVRDGQWFGMRRPCLCPSRAASLSEGPKNEASHDARAGQHAPSATMAAFKEQVSAQLQQFQQNLALHLQSFAPQMPNVPEYQAALLQRLASMMPHMGGGGASGQAETAGAHVDGRWWDLSMYAKAVPWAPWSEPPPSYDEIFSQEAKHPLHKKQASAARVALEADADLTFAQLLDQDEATSSKAAQEASSSEQGLAVPTLLQMGRKNGMTRKQEDDLRRAHAERLKRLSRDKNLFVVWIPLLIVVMMAFLYNQFPGLFEAVFGSLTDLLPERAPMSPGFGSRFGR